MAKRRIILGDYDTAANGWTLTGWKLAAAEQKTNYVEKTGGDGSWDLSTAMTDGIPRYKNRILIASFECSEGNRLSRETKIREMINRLDGMREDIVLPDDNFYHLNGRIKVAKNYNTLAHAAVDVTVTCDPWKYANDETVVTLEATSTAQVARLMNDGRRAVVPVIAVEDEVLLTYGSASLFLDKGSHKWPALLLTPGTHELTYKGTGSVTFTYREAVLE